MLPPGREDLIRRLDLNTDLARCLITGFIRDEITRVGIRRGVVGLSGGIDSALVAALAVEALGPENVLALLMPYRGSNPDSRADAELLVDQLELAHRVVEITPMVESYFEQMAQEGVDEAGLARRRGNIMARQRMIVLYDHSAAFDGLVIGTANKTEMLLGYSTQFGDAAAALHPIADLFKCQVRQLARAVGLPDRIMSKAPSADLWPGQTDEGELGFTYDEADQILNLVIDERRRPEELPDLGFEPSLVQAVLRRVPRNHYKRVPPLVCKLSARTIDSDFLYPRDWGV